MAIQSSRARWRRIIAGERTGQNSSIAFHSSSCPLNECCRGMKICSRGRLDGCVIRSIAILSLLALCWVWCIRRGQIRTTTRHSGAVHNSRVAMLVWTARYWLVEDRPFVSITRRAVTNANVIKPHFTFLVHFKIKSFYEVDPPILNFTISIRHS